MSETKKPKAGRGLKVALALSLGVNLMIVGIVAGLVLSRSDQGDVPALRTLGLGPFALALERDGRSDVRARLAETAAPLRADRREVGLSLRAMQAALRADPFDRAAAEAALERSRQAAAAVQARGHTALLDHIETVPLTRRIEMAERLERVVRRGTSGAGARGDGPPPPRGD